MKKKFTKIALVAFCLCLFVGCGISYYPVMNHNVSQTQVLLSQNNFRVLGTVSGETTTQHVLGIGGLSAKAARENAVAEMFKNANLTGSQTIVNINVKSHIMCFYVFYIQVRYTATGMIIEYVD